MSDTKQDTLIMEKVKSNITQAKVKRLLAETEYKENIMTKEQALKERIAGAVYKVIEQEQFLDEWRIAEGVLKEFEGEFQMLDLLIEEDLKRKGLEE